MAKTAAERQELYRQNKKKRNAPVTEAVTERNVTQGIPGPVRTQSYNPMMVGYVPPVG
jgi:hypothetical protein